MCQQLSSNLGASASWNPQGLSRPVMGLLYFTFIIIMYNVLRFSCKVPIIHPFPSIQGATAPSGPWPSSEDYSILLCLLLISSVLVFLQSVMCHSWQHPPILFLVFPLVLCYEISHYKLFFLGGGILSSSILIIWLTHPSLIILIQSMIFSSLYKLQISLFHLGCQGPVSCIPIILVRF
jgi:hypothetical protein